MSPVPDVRCADPGDVGKRDVAAAGEHLNRFDHVGERYVPGTGGDIHRPFDPAHFDVAGTAGAANLGFRGNFDFIFEVAAAGVRFATDVDYVAALLNGGIFAEFADAFADFGRAPGFHPEFGGNAHLAGGSDGQFETLGAGRQLQAHGPTDGEGALELAFFRRHRNAASEREATHSSERQREIDCPSSNGRKPIGGWWHDGPLP